MKSHAKVAAVAASTVAMSGGLILASSSPTYAAKSDCPSGYLCLWVDRDFQGSMYITQSNISDLPDWIEDEASSHYNNTKDSDWVIFVDKGHNDGKGTLCLDSQSSSGNLSNFGWRFSMEDKSSSVGRLRYQLQYGCSWTDSD